MAAPQPIASTAAVHQPDGLLKPMLASSTMTSFNLDSAYAKTKPSSSSSWWTHSIACSKGRWGGTVAACGVLLLVFLLLSSESSRPSNAGNLYVQTTSPSKYDNYLWKELPPAAKQAAKHLHWTHKSWTNIDYPAVYYQPWSQLSGAEQDAATVLGYTIGAWETVLNPTGAGDNTDVANDDDEVDEEDDDDDDDDDDDYEEEEDEGDYDDTRTFPPTSDTTSDATSEDTSDATSEDTSEDTN